MILQGVGIGLSVLCLILTIVAGPTPWWTTTIAKTTTDIYLTKTTVKIGDADKIEAKYGDIKENLRICPDNDKTWAARYDHYKASLAFVIITALLCVAMIVCGILSFFIKGFPLARVVCVLAIVTIISAIISVATFVGGLNVCKDSYCSYIEKVSKDADCHGTWGLAMMCITAILPIPIAILFFLASRG